MKTAIRDDADDKVARGDAVLRNIGKRKGGRRGRRKGARK